MSSINSSVHLVDHPLVRHHLTHLRREGTVPVAFRRHVRQLASLLAYEATQDLQEQPFEITTPLTGHDRVRGVQHHRSRADPPGGLGHGRAGPRPAPRRSGLASRAVS